MFVDIYPTYQPILEYLPFVPLNGLLISICLTAKRINTHICCPYIIMFVWRINLYASLFCIPRCLKWKCIDSCSGATLGHGRSNDLVKIAMTWLMTLLGVSQVQIYTIFVFLKENQLLRRFEGDVLATETIGRPNAHSSAEALLTNNNFKPVSDKALGEVNWTADFPTAIWAPCGVSVHWFQAVNISWTSKLSSHWPTSTGQAH